MLQRRHQARHADGESRRRHRLTAEARNQSVVASAAANRTETNGLAVLALEGKRQLNLVDRAGVVFEAADDGGINLNLTLEIAGCFGQIGNMLKFFDAAPCRCVHIEFLAQVSNCHVVVDAKSAAMRAVKSDEVQCTCAILFWWTRRNIFKWDE